MTTTHKNRASARRATAIGAERAAAPCAASVPTTADMTPDGGQGARSPRTHFEYANRPAGVSPRAYSSGLATLPALVVGAGLLGEAA